LQILKQTLFRNVHELHYKRIRKSIRKLFPDFGQLHLFQNKFADSQGEVSQVISYKTVKVLVL